MATRTISVAGGNFNATTAWDEAAVPVAGDAVVARGGGDSGNLTVNVASGGVGLLSCDFTNYAGTLTMTSTLTVSGAVTLSSGMTVSGTGDLICNTSATLTFSIGGGRHWTGGLQLKGSSQTYTMSGAWVLDGTLTLSGTTAMTANSSTIQCGNLTTTTATSGTTVITVATGGIWTGAGTLKNSLTMASNSTISGTVNYNTGTLTGAWVNSSSGLVTIALATTLAINSTAFAPQLSFTVAETITLASDLKTNGTILISANGVIFTGAFNITCDIFQTASTLSAITLPQNLTCSGSNGVLSLTSSTSTTFTGSGTITAQSCTISGTETVTPGSGMTVTVTGATTISDATVLTASGGSTWNTSGLTTTGALTGTQTITFNGSGSWQGAAACSNSVTVTGTVNLVGTVLYAASGTPTLTATGGTITGSSTPILSIASSCTIVGGTWPAITISAAATLTINSLITVTGALLGPNAAVTFAGSAGFNVNTFDNAAVASSGKTYTFTAGNTYTVTSLLAVSGSTAALTVSLVSSSGSATFALVLGPGATQDVAFVVATRVDSSAGQTIFDYKGTLTTATNWIVTYPINAGVAAQATGQVGM